MRTLAALAATCLIPLTVASPPATAAPPSFDGAAWIWHSDSPAAEPSKFPEGTCWFRGVLALPPATRVRAAELVITADNRFTFHLNGKPGGRGHDDPNAWNAPCRFDVAAFLAPGRNVLAVEAVNTAPGWAGLLARLEVTLEDGSRAVLVTDGGWRSAGREAAGWTRPDFDDTAWRAAPVVAAHGGGPWGTLAVPGDVVKTGAPPAVAAPKAASPPGLSFEGASWIWHPPPPKATLESFQGGTVSFRMPVDLPADARIASAEILLTADNLCTLYVNGKASAEGENWSQPRRVNIASRLVPGRNVIAIEATNTAMGPAGLIARLVVRIADGRVIEAATGPGWRCTDADVKDWELPAFDDRAWPPAHVVGPMGMPPWGRNVSIPPKAERAREDVSAVPGEGFAWPEGLVFLGEDCSLYPNGPPGPGAGSLGVTVFTARKSRAYPEHDLPVPIKFARKLFVLQPVRPDAAPRVLLDAGRGAIGTPCVTFDGRSILVAMARDGDPFYHIYRVPADGGAPEQLTGGPFHDIDPAELPDGRIVFTSTRIGTFEEYHSPPSRALFVMEPDGRDIRPLTHTFIFDNEAKVMADGRILFIRSDNFFDRGKVETLLHAVHPDGTGGYTEFGLDLGPGYGGRLRAFYCGSPAPMPDGRVAFVSAGGIVVGRPGGREQRSISADAGDVAAMPDGRLLVTLARRGNYQRIGVLDPDVPEPRAAVVFDGKGMMLHSPAFLGARPRPPVLAERVDRRKEAAPGATGVLYCQDARFTKNTTAGWPHVRAVRVLGGRGLTLRSSHSYIVHAGSDVVELGTVPLAPDGSFAVEVPADMAVAFQAVDAEGRSELNEMSWIYVRPGESRGCVGCHAPRPSAPLGRPAPVQAMRTRPVRLLGRGDPPRFRGNNAAVTGLMELQFDRYREVAGIDRHGGTGDPLATGAQEVAALAARFATGGEADRIAAAQRLGVFRDRAAAPALAARLRDDSLEVRVAASIALAACGDRESVPPLLEALADPEPVVAQAAAVAVENLTGRAEPFDAFAGKAARAAQARAWQEAFRGTTWEAVERDLVRRLEGADRDDVRRAAVALGHTGGDAARAALRARVARDRDVNPYPEWRKHHHGDGAQFDSRSPANPRTLQEVARALGWLRDREAVPLLAETLARHAHPVTGNLFLAEAVAEALGRIPGPEAEAAIAGAFAGLRDYIEFTSWYGDHGALMACHASPVHYFIMEALDARGSTAAAAPLAAHLIRSLPTDTDRALFFENDDYETLAGRVLRRAGAARAVIETCLAVLGEPGAARTPEVVKALATHGAWGGRPDAENRAAQVLSLVCRDRADAPRLLAAFERYRARPVTIPRVFDDGIPVVKQLPARHWVCFFLVRALGNLADPASAETLRAALEQSPPEASGGRPDPTGAGVLFLHNDLTPCWRAAVAWALGRIGDRRALPVLMKAAGDLENAPDTRHAAAVAAGRLAGPADVPALRRLAEGHPEVSTRKALLEACARGEASESR